MFATPTTAVPAGAPERGMVLAPFQTPKLALSLGQIVTSFGGFATVWAALLWAVDHGLYWPMLVLAPLGAGFLVRIFIIQHDCGHGSFFASRRANDRFGALCGLVTLTPYSAWRRQHAGHHRVSNDLDFSARGADIYSSCLTLHDYNALSPWRRRWQRVLRHWSVSNLLLPPLIFLMLYRVPFDTPSSWHRERRGVYLTDFAIVVEFTLLFWLLGFTTVLAVQLPVTVLASIVGVWLFSIQHRFEQSLWLRHDRWSFRAAAVSGSSYLRLPPLLQWFTGNIGFHQVHHMNPRIPNYRLEECYQANPEFQDGPVLTLGRGLAQWRFALWDEDQGRMVPFPPAESGAPENRR